MGCFYVVPPHTRTSAAARKGLIFGRPLVKWVSLGAKGIYTPGEEHIPMPCQQRVDIEKVYYLTAGKVGFPRRGVNCSGAEKAGLEEAGLCPASEAPEVLTE